MNSGTTTLGRSSPATFVLRFLPLADVMLDPANIGASRGCLRYAMSTGIEMAAYRCGVFVFDCSRWAPGGVVDIPALPFEDGGRLPKAYLIADDEAFEHVVNRVRMANCFLACLSDGISRRQSTALSLGQVLDPSTYRPIGLIDRRPLDLRDMEIEPLMHRLEHSRPPGSPSITVKSETIDYAVGRLDTVMQNAELAQLVELYYKSCFQYARHDHALAATIAWTVCEKALNELWRRRLDDVATSVAGADRMKRNRRDKLEGYDFTASIKTEFLELLGILESDLFEKLNTARSVRNKWMHKLVRVDSYQSGQAIDTARKMIDRTYGVDLLAQLSYATMY